MSPAAPSDCAPVTVNFNAATSPLATAAVVNVSYHFSTNTNDWASAAMTRTGSNTFSHVFNTVPDNAPQLEVAFNDGVNWANNGGGNWKVAIRDCDAPVNGVNFIPAAPNGCDPVTIRYYPVGRPLATATSVFIHVGRNGWQDALAPDPAMTNAGTYWEYVYVLPTNTTVIDVVFNNGAGVWDNNGGSDWHVAVTNCGDAPEPLPAVTLIPTNPGACDPITIVYNPSGRDLVGANIDINESAHAVASSYFEVRGRLRLGDAMVDERSLVRKQGIDVTTLWRERGAFDRETTQPLPGAQR